MVAKGTNWQMFADNAVAASIEAIQQSSLKVWTEKGKLYVQSPQQQFVSVIATDGRIVYNNQVTMLSLTLPSQCYVVQAGGKSVKVMVK